MCQILALQLTRAGYEVECVGDAAPALDTLSNEPFDLVITDLMMPGTSGLELLRRIRRIANDIPVIILTGRESLHSAIVAAGLRVGGYLIKGTTSGSDLVEAIEHALSASPSS
jgi:DNA-binding response OmpR family regulator